MEYNPISCQICALGFHFCSSWEISGNFGVFFTDAVKSSGTGELLLGNPSFGSCPFGSLSLQSTSPSSGCASPHVHVDSFRLRGIFIHGRGENLSLSFSPSERLIRYLGQQGSCGILYFNSISGEQHPVLIFHFGLFFLRAFLLV